MAKDKPDDELESHPAHAKPDEPKPDEGQEPELKKDEQGRTVVEGPASSSTDKGPQSSSSDKAK